MGCDRCGGEFERYRLEGREALVCGDCGYVDVPVEHGRSSGPAESWHTAFERFYDRVGESPTGASPVRSIAGDEGSTDAGRRPDDGEGSPDTRLPAVPTPTDPVERDGAGGHAAADGAGTAVRKGTDGGDPTDSAGDPLDGLDGDDAAAVVSVDGHED